jgi:hypothetical protein
MWKKRKPQQAAPEEPAPHGDWLLTLLEEQLRIEKEEKEAIQALPDEERIAAEIQADVNKQKNAQNYAWLMRNIMSMKQQTASNIIGNMRS